MKWSEKEIPDLSGKRILVTGAASGIGFEAARALAEHGAEVFLADINEKGGETALTNIRASCAEAKVVFRRLDLSSQQAVKAFAQSLLEEGKPLDVLINNAGIQPPIQRRTTVDGFEVTFGIGHLGHFTLTGLLLPLLLKASAPRVVTVASLAHKMGSFDFDDLQVEHNYHSQRPYNQTKLANMLFGKELQRRAGNRLLSVVVHPGVARTNIGSGRQGQVRGSFWEHMIDVILAFVMTFLGQDADAGAMPTMYAASMPGLVPGGYYGPDGFGGMKGSPVLTQPNPRGLDMETAAKLWQASEQLTGIRYDALT